MKAVFDTRPVTSYDDDVTHRYHFPDRYLEAARRTLGDWVLLREPRRGGGREGYVAVARVERITPDPERPMHSYAWLSDFLPFDEVVPLRRGAGFYEVALNSVPAPARIGAALQGRSIRNISDAEFGAVARAGLQATLDPANAIARHLAPTEIDFDTAAALQALPEEQERRIVQLLVNRKVRDAAFRGAVCAAYDNRCAVTRLRIVNGGGRAEVQAAHLWPVATGGPDVVQNGIALSATVHWLFDRHLISLTDNYGLLISHNKVPSELRTLFTRQLDKIHLPADRELWPHLDYVRRHREAFAAG